ncbi:MAG TPA: hypothetical protein VHU91_03470 [Mycobacteriales bacterium]|jgi:hypothetical protein|nr:hypothetical protein [Mycobacteriales bacterium]
MFEQLIAEPHFVEAHRRSVPATPLEAYEALQRITLAQMPIARKLFAIRGLISPGGLVSDPERPLLAQMAQQGFAVLVDEPDREFAIGAIGQPW